MAATPDATQQTKQLNIKDWLDCLRNPKFPDASGQEQLTKGQKDKLVEVVEKSMLGSSAVGDDNEPGIEKRKDRAHTLDEREIPEHEPIQVTKLLADFSTVYHTEESKRADALARIHKELLFLVHDSPFVLKSLDFFKKANNKLHEACPDVKKEPRKVGMFIRLMEAIYDIEDRASNTFVVYFVVEAAMNWTQPIGGETPNVGGEFYIQHNAIALFVVDGMIKRFFSVPEPNNGERLIKGVLIATMAP